MNGIRTKQRVAFTLRGEISVNRTNLNKHQVLANLCESIPNDTFNQLLELRRKLAGSDLKSNEIERAWQQHAQSAK